MVYALFSAALFVVGLLAVCSDLRQALGAVGVSGLVMASVAVVVPSIAGTESALPSALSGVGLIQLGSSFLAGVIAGAPLVLVYQAVSVLGRTIDFSAGLLIAEQLVPGSMERQSPTQSVFMLGATALFLSPELASMTLLSYSGVLPLNLSTGIEVSQIFYLLGESLRVGVRLALPVVCVLVVFEIGIGMFSRYLQAMSLAADVPSLKLAMAVLLLALCGDSLLERSVGSAIGLVERGRALHVQR